MVRSSGIKLEVSSGVLRLDFRLHALSQLLQRARTLPSCSVAWRALFDGQKSTRSRVHFKLNLFAGAKWSAKRARRVGKGKHSLLPDWVIHCFDALTSMCLVVAHVRFLSRAIFVCMCVPVACQFLLSFARFPCRFSSLNGHVTLNSGF